LNASCSIINLSIIASGWVGLSVILLVTSMFQNNHHHISLDFLDRSRMVSILCNKVPRSQKSSNAPDLMSHSSDFLLTTGEHLLTKSSISLYAPFFFLSSWMDSPISSPSPLMQKNHNLIASWMAAT
jgi:hypothetical protein